MKKQWTSWQVNIVYLLLFISISWFYGIFETINHGPYSHHQWRQSDCLSITQHYYQGDLPFLEPEIHWQGKDQAGKTISEFPIVYYVVGKLWQLFGKHYWIYRLINFLIVAIGLYYLKKLSNKLLEDPFWTIFVPLLLFSSPLLAHYSNNYLMNANALSFAIIASYLFYRHRIENSYKYLIYSCIIFLLAGLLKITSLMLFFAFFVVFLYTMLWKERSLKTRWKELLPYAGTLIGIFAWYMYTGWYNANNMSDVFLQGVLPIWELGWADIHSIWKSLNNDLKPFYFNVSVLFFLGLSGIGLLLNYKKTHKYLFPLTAVAIIGIVCYILLFFQVFDHHEYYLIGLLFIIPLLSLLLLTRLIKHNPTIFKSGFLKITASIGLLFLIYSAGIQTRARYDISQEWVRNSSVLDKAAVDYWDWFHWNYGVRLKELETIEPYLEQIGVKKEDKVISIPDESINISLYLMNRDGWSDYGNLEYQGAARIEKAKEWGAKYLVISYLPLLEEEYLQPYLTNKIGETEHVTIFKL